MSEAGTTTEKSTEDLKWMIVAQAIRIERLEKEPSEWRTKCPKET